MAKWVSPITSMEQLEMIGNELTRYGIQYQLLFRLLYETGRSADEIIHYTKDMLYQKKTIAYDKERTRLSYECMLSEKTCQLITKIVEDNIEEERLFLDKQNNDFIKKRTFMVYINRAAIACSMNDITLSGLRKTFIYNEYLRTGDIGYVRKLTGKDSYEEVIQYLGIPLFEKDFSKKRSQLFYDASIYVEEITGFITQLEQLKKEIQKYPVSKEAYLLLMAEMTRLQEITNALENIKITP